MPHGSLACKRACGGGYLSGGKRQAYHAGKTLNQPNHQLTFQPSPSIPRCSWVYNLGLPLKAYSSTISFPVINGKNPKDTVFSFSCLFSAFLWHRSYARESDAAHSAAKGGGFLPQPQNDSSTIRAQHAAEFCGEPA